MLEFYKTQGGRSFFDGTVPRLIRTLERIADCLEKEQERQATVKAESEGACLEGVDTDSIEAMTESINKAAGKKVVEVVDEGDYWQGTVLFNPAGGSEGQWERYYFKAGGPQIVEEWLWGNFGEAIGVFVEPIDYEIDTELDIIDLT